MMQQPDQQTETASMFPEDSRASMPFLDHLKELRIRLTYALIAIVIGSAIGMILVLIPSRLNLVDLIILTFVPPKGEAGLPPLQTVGTVEAFSSYMTVALAFGIVLAMPVLVYQLLAFVVPGLTDQERRFLYKAIPFVMIAFCIGLAFGWLITVPVAIQFLTEFGNPELIQNQPRLSDFLQTVTVLLVINGVIFELPIIIYVLARMQLITAQQLASYRRYAVIVVVVVAAIITPTGDPINLLLMALPMYLLFELGILLARLVPDQQEQT